MLGADYTGLAAHGTHDASDETTTAGRPESDSSLDPPVADYLANPRRPRKHLATTVIEEPRSPDIRRLTMMGIAAGRAGEQDRDNHSSRRDSLAGWEEIGRPRSAALPKTRPMPYSLVNALGRL